MHISPCVVNVMAAAAADFPGFPKPYTAANLETKPSGTSTKLLNHQKNELFHCFQLSIFCSKPALIKSKADA